MLGLIRRQHPLEIQASEMANHIQAKLSRMGMEHRRSVAGADYEERQVVSFRSIEASPEFVKIRLDVDSLPRGVTTAKIRDPEVLEDLGYALGYRVSFESRDRQQGCWFVIHLRDNDGLPRLVPFAQMLHAFPARPAPLMIPLGVAADGVRWANLREFPHLLMAGATGKGKSNEVHAILLSLLRLPPEDLQLVLVDLKGGITLGQYKDVPHTSRTVYIRKADKLPQMLLGLQTEMERRTDLMERYGVEDIEEYNKLVRARERKRYIVVVIEEIANAMLVKSSIKMPDNERAETIAVATERLLADIAGRSRAEGIHMICTTQHPDSTVLTGLIKANFPVRIAFGTSSKTASRVILDDSGARGLIPGRFLMLYNADYTYMQAPLIEDAERRSIIRRIQHNERWLRPQSGLARRNRDLLMLLQVVARDFGGVIRMHDDELRRMCRQPDLKSARITPGKIREYAGILHADQLVKRGWGGDYKIATCRKTWKATYPVDEAVLSDTDASEPVCEDDIIEGEVLDAGTGTEPAIRLLEPPDPRADEIRRWADSGHSRNQMARMLRMNKAEALKLIERVLGPAEAQQKNLFDLLVYRQKANRIEKTRFISIRTWRSTGRKQQIELLKAMKELCSDEDLAHIVREMIEVIQDSMGTITYGCITHPPRGGSRSEKHFATELAQRVASATGMKYFRAFEDRPHAQGHHPRLAGQRGELLLLEKPPAPICVLIDDVATSGYTISECHAALAPHATMFSLVWIYGEVKR